MSTLTERLRKQVDIQARMKNPKLMLAYKKAIGEKISVAVKASLAKKQGEAHVRENYQPFKEQQEIHDALRPILSGLTVMAITGRRFGKTTIAVNEIIQRAIEMPSSRIWYIAHTEKQAYRIAWKLMLNWRLDKNKKRHPPYLPDELIKKKREDQHTIELKNGSLIEFLGTVKELPMLGAGLHFVVFDEFPGIHWAVWVDIVRPMLIDFKGDALFIGTVPDPIEYDITPEFIEMYEDALFGRLGYKGFNFSSSCNPYIDKGMIERDIKEWERKGRSADAKRLYHGKYSREYGLVWPKFNYDIHTVEPFELPGSWTRGMAVDPHPQKPGNALWVAIDPRNHYWFYREMEFSNDDRPLTIPEASYTINMTEATAKEKLSGRLIDPTYAKIEHTALGSKSVKDLFRDNGLNFLEGDRTFATFKHRVDDMLVDEPDPTFHIFRSCPNFIRQMQNYTWDSWASRKARSEKGKKDKPKKKDDDYVDCCKMILNSNLRYIDINQFVAIRSHLDAKWQQGRIL